MVVHAAVALAAFGAMGLTGVYGSMASRLGRPGALEEVRRYFARPPRVEALVFAVAVLGAAALAADPHGRGFAQLWVTLALMLWVTASVLWIRVVHPAEMAIRSVFSERSGTGVTDADPPPVDDGDSDDVGPDGRLILTVHGRRLRRSAAATNLIFVVALGLMIFRPH